MREKPLRISCKFTSHEAIAQAIINAYLPHPQTLLPKVPETHEIPPQIPHLPPQRAAPSLHLRRRFNRLHFSLLQPSVSPLSSATPSADHPPRIFSANRESSVRYQDPNYEHHLGARNNYRYASGVGRVPVGIGRKRTRIVVTGGAGFVGSHLVDKLIARGDDVIVVDNFFTGRKDNLVHLFGNPRFELIRHDVVEPILLEVDQIYHLACPASPVHYKYNPVKTIISFFSVFTAMNLSSLLLFGLRSFDQLLRGILDQ
ncbi:UNVERIFIED_CONTAM: UDP-glucuronic acid decarboxylase 1 [Sesamum radiatum]|uniref:UDP-glucuronate decarboxylase n=1 Tax=Sesamum radiatum TaxID=300843 RepID=A0AAW2R5L5_SESRA